MNIPDGYALLEYSFSAPGQDGQILTTIGIENLLGDPEDALAAMLAAFESNVLPLLNTSVTVLELIGRFGQPTGDPLTVSLADGVNHGGVSGEMFPVNTAILVQKRSLTGGRAGRGRMYLPGVNKVDVTDAGLFEDTPRGAMQSALDDFLQDAITATTVPVILHNDISLAPSSITTLTADARVATQRKRLRG